MVGKDIYSREKPAYPVCQSKQWEDGLVDKGVSLHKSDNPRSLCDGQHTSIILWQEAGRGCVGCGQRQATHPEVPNLLAWSKQ